MAELVNPTRSKNMGSIKSRATKLEVFVHGGLHKLGFRFSIHSACLPDRPDIVSPKYKAVIFIISCFWHGHNCHVVKLPNQAEWREEIARNRMRDKKTRLCMMTWIEKCLMSFKPLDAEITEQGNIRF